MKFVLIVGPVVGAFCLWLIIGGSHGESLTQLVARRERSFLWDLAWSLDLDSTKDHGW
jgi:hypothetical protein